MRYQSSVPLEHSIKPVQVATGALRGKVKDAVVRSLRAAKAVAGNEIVIVERREDTAADSKAGLIRVGTVGSPRDGMKAAPLKAALPRPFVALGQVDADDQVGRFEPG